MREYLDYPDFLSQLIMHNLPTIIVEGHNDITLFRNLLIASETDLDSIIILSPENIYEVNNKKGIVIKSIIDLNNICKENGTSRHKKLIGIVDSDFNQICGNCKIIPNLFYTDKHDLDSQIFSSDAFKKFLNSYYWEPEKIETRQVKEVCVELARDFGYYLLSLYENNLHYLMKEIKPIYFYFDKDLNFNNSLIAKKIGEFKNQGMITDEILKKIEDKLSERKNQDVDDYQVTNGHDLVRILTMLTIWGKFKLKKKGMGNKFKSTLAKDPEKRKYLVNEIEDLLRGSYDLSFFKKSILCASILEYQKRENLFFININ